MFVTCVSMVAERSQHFFKAVGLQFLKLASFMKFNGAPAASSSYFMCTLEGKLFTKLDSRTSMHRFILNHQTLSSSGTYSFPTVVSCLSSAHGRASAYFFCVEICEIIMFCSLSPFFPIYLKLQFLEQFSNLHLLRENS